MSGVLAVIPARGGSKRIPGKNLVPLAGLPLVAHTILHATRAARVDEVVVSTDDPGIAAVARAHGAGVVERPTGLATDEATTEAAVLHVLDERGHDPDLVVLLQCTSPVRAANDVDHAIEQLLADGADSLLSVTRDHSFLWRSGPDGAEPLNYDPRARPREQDQRPQYRENGSLYVFRPELLRRTGARLGGRVALYEMDYWSSFQIDEPEDVELVGWILRGTYASGAWPGRLELVVFDFDGVMTDDVVVVGSEGEEAVRCHRGDGLGLARLRDAGVPLLVLSSERNGVVGARCEKLGIPYQQAVEDKRAALAGELERRGLDAANVAYVGNDVNDLGALSLVGLPVAVADAHPEVVAAALLVLTREGGRGAVREFCDLVLARLGAGG